MTIEGVVAGIIQRPWGPALLVVGDFNTNLAALEVWERDMGTAAIMMEEGMEDMILHYLPCHKPWFKDFRIWDMNRGGWEVRSWTDYILGKNSHLFQNVSVQDLRHNTEHYLVLG